MPEIGFGFSGRALHSVLALNDAEIARLIAALDQIVADPVGCTHRTSVTKFGRVTRSMEIPPVEIHFVLREPSNYVWVVDVRYMHS